MVAFPFFVADPVQLKLLNTLISHSKRVSFTFKDHTYTFEIAVPFTDYKPDISCTLRAGQELFLVGLSPLPSTELLGSSLQELNLQDCPVELKTALLECWFEEILKALEATFQTAYKIESLDFNPPALQQNEHIVYFNIHTADSTFPTFKGHLALNEALFSSFLIYCDSIKASPPKQLFSDILFKGRIEVGETILSLNELYSLEKNDILFLDRFYPQDNQPLQLNFEPTLSFKFRQEHSRATILSTHMKPISKTAFNPKLDFLNQTEVDIDDDTELGDDETSTAGGKDTAKESVPTTNAPQTTPSNNVTTPPQVAASKAAAPATPNTPPTKAAASAKPATEASQPLPLEQLTVQLSFQVGEKYLTLSELQLMKAGYTFELESTVDKPVTIYANGTPIGMGELVQIEKRVGVRILDWGKTLS
jgi:type III secretion system YscQ/HrcQ family protein